jgi:hypothetical protein
MSKGKRSRHLAWESLLVAYRNEAGLLWFRAFSEPDQILRFWIVLRLFLIRLSQLVLLIRLLRTLILSLLGRWVKRATCS